MTEGGWMGRGGEGRAEKVKEGGGEGMLGWVQYTGGGGEERERYRGGEFEQVSCLIRNPKKRLNCWLYNMQQSLSS